MNHQKPVMHHRGIVSAVIFTLALFALAAWVTCAVVRIGKDFWP
jgi:hypothetical protein